ncbi:response regulator [bacterium]|nr:response regulator [bacterium]
MKDTHSIHILIIDDDPTYLKMMRSRLEKVGYQILTAPDGLMGLNLARKEKPDLILLDLMLPGMDGHKVCRLIKFDQHIQHIPVLMVTSRDLDEDADMAKKCGAVGFIVKTTRFEVTLDIIKRLLDRTTNKTNELSSSNKS